MTIQDFCAGWHDWGSPNCTIMDEFKHTSAASLNSSTTTAKYQDYGGGGYVFQIRGYISDLEKKVQVSAAHLNYCVNLALSFVQPFGGIKGINVLTPTNFSKPNRTSKR